MYGHSIAPTTLALKENFPLDSACFMREQNPFKRSSLQKAGSFEGILLAHEASGIKWKVFLECQCCRGDRMAVHKQCLGRGRSAGPNCEPLRISCAFVHQAACRRHEQSTDSRRFVEIFESIRNRD